VRIIIRKKFVRKRKINEETHIIRKRSDSYLYMSPIVGTIIKLLIIALDLSKLSKSFANIFTCKSPRRLIVYQ